MIEGIIGKKIGMTQILNEKGEALPITIIQAGPCVVVQKRVAEKDGYSCVQIGLVENRTVKGVTKAMKGHFEKHGITQPIRVLREMRIAQGGEVNEGAEFKVDFFEETKMVDVIGVTKGKGFQGVIKRHGFHGGRITHGSMFHRAPGSSGANTYPGEVKKGKKLPGHAGTARKTIKNLRVEKIIKEENLILVRGAVPGPNGGVVIVRKSDFK
ncbi:MAG TPA: 50S ribosomal protein L3 [Candidatus Aminicenantes bacterium]|mgnify:FL=1|nr:50S ribosomal protein L3 [Candidatus Aminicenantes bacterium]